MRHPSLEVHPSGDEAGAPLRNRTVDLLLTMSISGRGSTAAMLVRAGSLSSWCWSMSPVFAPFWHAAGTDHARSVRLMSGNTPYQT